MGKDRPELTAPPEIFYDEREARKYTDNSRMIAIQAALTERALELLALPDDGVPRLLLDLGCGSGLSGARLTEAGHHWVGTDISPAMLAVAAARGAAAAGGDLALGDLGHGLPLRRGAFDGAVSISAVQWLCNADAAAHNPHRRLRRFFETLYACLARGARAVLQVYPDGAAQATMLTSAATRAGFAGGLVVDYPHSARAKKFFLVLMVGGGAPMPAARGAAGGDAMDESASGSDGEIGSGGGGGEGHVRVEARRTKGRRGGAPRESRREKVLRKKQRQRARGQLGVRADTKYSGRKRKDRF